MGIEVEAKIRLPGAAAAALRDRLAAVGATFDRHLVESNTYYDTPEGSLKTADRGLRIRVEVNEATGDRRVILTHKGPQAQGPLKNRLETEATVDDPSAAAELLAALGYHATLTFEKRRARYLLDGCRVEIDQVPFLGTFVEIEATAADDVERVRAHLSLADQPLIRDSYVAMLAAHLREHPKQVSDDPAIRLTDDPSCDPALQ